MDADDKNGEAEVCDRCDEAVARSIDREDRKAPSVVAHVGSVLQQRRAARAEILKRARVRRSRIGPIAPEEIEAWIAEGRP